MAQLAHVYNACNNKRTGKKCSYVKGTDYKSAPAGGIPIMLHKPHPTGIMKHYQMKQIKEVLGL